MPTTFPDRTRAKLTRDARRKGVLSALLYGVVGLVALFALIPIIYLGVRATEKPLSESIALILRPKTLTVLLTTSGLVSLVVVLTFLIGLAIATGLHFLRLPGRQLLVIPAVLPLAIPSYVFTYTWIALIPGFSGFFAAVFILTLTTLPYIILAALAGFRRINASQIEVARSLGLSHLEILSRVILPQIKGHLSSGVLLVALYTISDFGAVSLLNVETLTVSIQNMYKASYDRSAAAVISFILIALSTLVVLADEKFKDKSPEARGIQASSRKNALVNSFPLKVVIYAALTLFASVAVLLPFFVLLSRFLGNQVAINWSNVATASFSTIYVSALGALFALVLSAPLGALFSTNYGKFAGAVQRIITVGHGLPGVVVGLALVSIGSKLGAIYQTIGLLAVAYALLFLAKSVSSINASLSRVPAGVKEVASTLGLSQLAVLKRVVAPIAAPGIGLGTILVFLTSMKELPATLMLRPTGFETLATEIWTYAAINRYNEAAPYALILVLIAAIPTFLLSRPDKADRNYIQGDERGMQ